MEYLTDPTMITLCPSESCTGCHACYAACPQHCISMCEDRVGFLVPKIDRSRCVGCGRCTDVCPAIVDGKRETSVEPSVYAFVNGSEEVLNDSSSGGAFSAFADRILEDNGVVFGAAFDDSLHLRHCAVFSKEDLPILRRSKYVQSEIGDTFLEVEQYLKEKRPVLFVGTPCQVAGLKSFLGKSVDSENLLTIDLLCHGVPSPGVFKRHVADIERKANKKLRSIVFRHKRRPWGTLSVIHEFSDGTERELADFEDVYFVLFGLFIGTRPCCGDCLFAQKERPGDITIGDFWGIRNTDIITPKTKRKGISIVIVNAQKGQRRVDDISSKHLIHKQSYEDALRWGRQPLLSPPGRSRKQTLFFDAIEKDESLDVIAERFFPNYRNRYIFKKIFGLNNYYRAKFFLNWIKKTFFGKTIKNQ